MDDAQIIASEFERNLEIVSDPVFESADPETQAAILTAASEGGTEIDAREVNPRNVNGYVIYPPGIGVMSLTEARKTAREQSTFSENGYKARVEDADTEKVIVQYKDGREVNPLSTAAKYYKVWFSKGVDHTAQIIVDTDRYPKGKTSVESYSRLFPYSEAGKMTHLHIGDSFATWEEAFESERLRSFPNPLRRGEHTPDSKSPSWWYEQGRIRGEQDKNVAGATPDAQFAYMFKTYVDYWHGQESERTVLSSAFSSGFYDARAGRPRPRRSRNPESAAASLSESFHGRPAHHTDEYVDELHVHEFLTELGDLIELSVETESGYVATVRFSKSEGLKLASSENGRQLYIQGRCDLDLDALHMGSTKWLADLMVIGRITSLVYRTSKNQDGGAVTDYIHKSGESLDASGTKHVQATDVYPALLYDRLNSELQIAGGQQEVRPEGIIR